jgi:group I intron endonuclease
MMLVYLLLNTCNNKAYVGQTRHNSLNKRWNSNLSNSNSNPYLRAAIKKHGSKAFQRQILAECSTQAEADNLERLWIAVLRTYDRKCGYNIQRGGRKWKGLDIPCHTKGTVKRISESVRQWWRNRTPEELAQFGETMRAIWHSRSLTERSQIGQKIRSAKAGRRSRTKGRKFGTQANPCPVRPARTEEAKRNISAGLYRHWARKREIRRKISLGMQRYWARKRGEAIQRKPVMGTSSQSLADRQPKADRLSGTDGQVNMAG